MKLPKYYEDRGQTLYHFIKFKRRIPIKGIKKMEYHDLLREIENGERFVVFRYAIFMLFVYLKGISCIYFKKNSFRAKFARIRYILLSSFALLATMFYFFAVISSPKSNFIDLTHFDIGTIIGILLVSVCIIVPIPAIITNIKGGIDVTDDVLAFIAEQTTEDNILKTEIG